MRKNISGVQRLSLGQGLVLKTHFFDKCRVWTTQACWVNPFLPMGRWHEQRQKGETQSSYLTCPNLCPGNLSLLSKLFPLHHTLWACKVRLHRKTEKSQSQLTRQLIFFYMFIVVVLCILYSDSASNLPSLLSGCVIIKSNLDSMKLVVCTMELNSLLEKMNCLQTAPHSTRGHQSRQHRLRRLPIQQNQFHF